MVMAMGVSLTQVQPNAQGHKPSCHPKSQRCRFREKRKRQGGAQEGGGGEIGASARSAQSAQRQNKQNQTDAVAAKSYQ